MKTFITCLLLALVSEGHKFSLSMDLADDVKIFVESLFPKNEKEKWITMTKEEFKKNMNKIMYHEYKLLKVISDGNTITELHFRLPTEDEYKRPELDERKRTDLEVAKAAE